MANFEFFLLLCFLSSFILLNLGSGCAATNEDRKVYVVYMGALPSHADYMPVTQHLNILQEVVGSISSENLLIRSYKRSFNGFAAKLTEAEREKVGGMEGVVSVFERKKLKLQTTRSWNFMGFGENLKRDIKVEGNIIVGMIDTGIWPESASFDDEGFGPPPKKWKGACEGGQNFTCNNKIIGARYYLGSDVSARDNDGHGTHTASIAAGNNVKGASFYGLAEGTARGGVPSARIAVYRVCDEKSCDNDAILSSFDDAIADGVDLISISIGGDASLFEEDPTAIGAFHAMEKGILTVNSAGNDGPDVGTVGSVAPWILTVAASTTDRMFIDKIILGNGMTLVGKSVNSFDLNGTMFPLVYGENASSKCSRENASLCYEGCLDSNLVKGKIVLCALYDGDHEALRAGATASIVPSVGYAQVVSLPAAAIDNADDYESVDFYMNSTKNPVATILRSETVKDSTAPIVASFSSRGPNMIIGDILKPDITAPGVEILAAYSPVPSASDSKYDPRHVKYNVLLGTSMSCPHVAGVAAYLKTIHPDWSPSLIKSALMTTAWPMDRSESLDDEFAYGAGHVDPTKAADPGLVYEASKEDYIKMLCGVNYSNKKLRKISGDSSSCLKGSDKSLVRDLNYPSMAAKLLTSKPFKFTFYRTVTNIGSENSTYKGEVTTDSRVNIKLVPKILSFKSLYEKRSFQVTVSGRGLNSLSFASGSLVWYDGTHRVRSPIVVYHL